MAMRRIHLDFMRVRRPTGIAGWALLLFGLACIGAVIAWNETYWQPLNTVTAERLRSVRAASEVRRAALAKMDDAQLLTEWKRAITVADTLNLPWEKLFATFEADVGEPVAILSLAPDAEKHELVLTAEAKNFDAMLANFRRLQQQEIFSDLALHSHQINRQDRENPIRFRITAKWTARS